MKKNFLSMLLLLVTVCTWASNIEVDGISYELSHEDNTASVTHYVSSENMDQIYGVLIPSSIVSDGVTYAVTSIAYAAFRGCSSLTSVSIPNSVTGIGKYAFNECTSLPSISIPNSVTYIGYGAFMNCLRLSSITIPNSLSEISNSSFAGCSNLDTIVIPQSVTTIWGSAFKGSEKLDKVICYAPNPPSAGDNVFLDSRVENAILIVPEDAVNAYKSTEPWSNFGTIATIEESEIQEPLKCVAPKIAYNAGNIKATSETKNSVCHIWSTFVASDGIGDDNVSVNCVLRISAYATADGYGTSDTTILEVPFGGTDVNGDGETNISDVTTLVNKILGK